MRPVRRPPIVAVVVIAALALAVPILPLADPLRMDVANHLAAPSLSHPLGLDEFGRDVLSRLLWGARTSLLVAAASASLACIFGVVLGLAGGYLRGVTELLAVRSMDIVLCFPPLLLALLIVTLLGPGTGTLIPLLAVLYLPGFVRVVNAGVLSVRSRDYVEAMRALGARPRLIMVRTILPNIAGPVLVQLSLAAASAIVLEFGPVIPWPGCGAAGAIVGTDDRRGTVYHGTGAAASVVALCRAVHDDLRNERTVRRAA